MKGYGLLLFHNFYLVHFWITGLTSEAEAYSEPCQTPHCVKSVRIRRFSGPYFPAFGLNTKRYGVSLRIQLKCGKIRTRRTLNTNTFHAVSKTELFANISNGSQPLTTLMEENVARWTLFLLKLELTDAKIKCNELLNFQIRENDILEKAWFLKFKGINHHASKKLKN